MAELLTRPWTEFLVGELAERRLPRRLLAWSMGITPEELDELIDGRRELTEDIAARIGHVLGTSAQMWLNLDRIHRAELEQRATDTEGLRA